MLPLFLTVATVLLALCIMTDRAADRSNVTITRTDGDTREGYADVTGGRVRLASGVSTSKPILPGEQDHRRGAS